jgi:hypothetical protein
MNKDGKPKTKFTSIQIRPLSENEQKYRLTVEKILDKTKDDGFIAIIPKFVSADCKSKMILIKRYIIDKITFDHGSILVENLIINANDWDIVLKNVDGNMDKINLIKLFPDSSNYLVIGANRDNGYFLVTHYEVIADAGNELKSLLGRGDSLDKYGFPLEPFVNGTFFRKSEPERVSGKGTDTDTIPNAV